MFGRRSLMAVCVVLLMSAARCWSAVRCSPAGWSSTEFALPAISGAAFWPRVSGDWAVALQNTNPNNISSTVGVVCYDLAKRQAYTLYSGKAASHAISGNLVAWSGKSDNIPTLRGTRGVRGTWPSCLILYDLPTGRCSAPKLKTNSAFVLAMTGDFVAYEMGCRIYLYNTRTGAQMRISDNAPSHRNPDVGGDLVVWQQYADRSFKQCRILGYRISTRETLEFPGGFASNSGPKTDGNTIVWSTTGGAKVYDVKSRIERSIPSAQFPDVSNGVVVYLKGAGCACGCGGSRFGRGVYGTDLSMKGEFRVSRGTADRPPSIDNRRVVWAKGGVVYCADIKKVP